MDRTQELRKIPNVGPAVAGDLLRLGITSLRQLKGKDPGRLYEKLCRIDGMRHDICMLDVLEAIVSYADGGPARPWWEFSRKRKARERRG